MAKRTSAREHNLQQQAFQPIVLPALRPGNQQHLAQLLAAIAWRVAQEPEASLTNVAVNPRQLQR